MLDRPLAQWSREGLARAIAYLPQGADAHWPMLARQLVSLGRLPHRAALCGAVAGRLRCRRRSAGALRCAASSRARRMDELSAGERARVLFARALATAAPILLADEPAAYLDPAHQLRLMELLREEAARGTAVAVTLHDLSLASRHCDEIVVLRPGQGGRAGRAGIGAVGCSAGTCVRHRGDAARRSGRRTRRSCPGAGSDLPFLRRRV